MLYFIAVWTLLLSISCVIGIGLLNLLHAESFKRVSDRGIASVWLGVITLAVTLLAVSLVAPLTPATGIGVAIALCSASLLSRQTRLELVALKHDISCVMILGYLVVAILCAALTNGEVVWVDTGLYHYSVIQWLGKFGTVPGLALLFANFGFTSSWFALATPLNPEILGSRVTVVTNGFVFLIGVLQFLICLKHGLNRQARFSDWFLGLFSLFLLFNIARSPFLSGILISASPDTAAAFLAGIVSWAMVVVANAEAPQFLAGKPVTSYSSAVPLFLATGAVTVKLTTLPLLVTGSLFYIAYNRTSIQRLVIGGAIAALLLAPFLTAQILTSGCPLYPSSVLCLNLPWSKPPQLVQEVARLTHQWTSWHSSNSAENSLLQIAWHWFTDNGGNQLIVLLSVMSTLAVIVFLKPLLKSELRGIWWVIAIQIVGMLFQVKTTLTIRFALPYLLLIPALLGAMYSCSRLNGVLPAIANKFSRPLFRQPSKLLSLLALFIISVTFSAVIASGTASRLVLPPPLREVQVVQKHINGITYFSPQNNEVCWSTKIPCAFEIPSSTQLRIPKSGIAGGFIYQESLGIRGKKSE